MIQGGEGAAARGTGNKSYTAEGAADREPKPHTGNVNLAGKLESSWTGGKAEGGEAPHIWRRPVRKDSRDPAKDTWGKQHKCQESLQSLPSGNTGLVLQEACVASCLFGLEEQLMML